MHRFRRLALLLLLAAPWWPRGSGGQPPPFAPDLPRIEGERLFRRIWIEPQPRPVFGDGLGPLFNAASCAFCHLAEAGAVHPPEPGHGEAPLLVRLSVEGEAGQVLPEPRYGWQLQERGAGGVPAEGRAVVTWTERPGRYPDGMPYRLREPSLRFADLADGPLAPRVQTSLRFPPALAGLGLLEAVPEAEILRGADPEDADRDGVSGRPNRVTDLRTGIPALGRFGWKAGQPTLEQQNATALQEDMGITSDLLFLHACRPAQQRCRAADAAGGPEITAQELERLTQLTRDLPAPVRRVGADPAVARGAALFRSAGCVSCHRPRLLAADGKPVEAYTDLLLHDLGTGLADGRPEFLATGREWRTAPLWGLSRVVEGDGEVRLLHDGRARSLEEAILWHGGEAEAARERFQGWGVGERAALLRFLGSL